VLVAAALLAPGAALAAPPANDDFAGAAPLEGEAPNAEGTTVGATGQAGEPRHGGEPGGASVWYSWTATRSRIAHLELCSGGWDGVVAVYAGSALTQLVPLGSGFSESGRCGFTAFRATAGMTYRLAVDGRTVEGILERGAFSLRLSSAYPPPPANDDFENPGSLSSFGNAVGTTEGANRQPGEPQHGADPVGASVWYRWTAPASGPMVLYACRAGFRLALGVYTGASLGGLVSVGRSGGAAELPNANLGYCELGGQGSVSFDAVAGTPYSIAVDGEGGGFGSFQVELLSPTPAFLDTFPPSTYITALKRLGRHGMLILFSSSEPGTFACKLDGAAFRPCRTPQRFRRLTPGRHRFAVKAIDAAGNEDATPAVRSFRIGGKR
jgi:hypothetical protein